MDNMQHKAGAKILAWRQRHSVTRDALGERLGEKLGREALPKQTIYNWEARGKVARPPIQRVLVDMGVCSAADWLEPAPEAESSADSAAA